MLAATLALTLAVKPDYSAAAEYSASKNGFSFLVMENGRIVAEEYPNGGSATRPTELASGTKSFSGVLAACAIQDGIIKGWDEKVSDTITEWKSDRMKVNITVRQLLSLSSGIPGGTVGRPPSYKDAIKIESTAMPGRRFQYGPAPFQCFGEFMRRKLKGEDVLAYMERRIFKPLGIKHGIWRKDADGNPHLPSGAFFTAREWAKFGEMVRLGGKGVVKQSLLDECLKSQGANRGYGLTWWLPTQGPSGARPLIARRSQPLGVKDEIYRAAGAGGQMLYVIRSRNLVVVRQAPVRLGRDADSFNDAEFLRLLLNGK